MARLRIPKSLRLMGHDIEVVMVDDLIEECELLGDCDFYENVIRIQTPIPGILTRSQAVQTYYHELLHFAFHLTGYEKESQDEQMVDRIAQLIHQALVSAKYK